MCQLKTVQNTVLKTNALLRQLSESHEEESKIGSVTFKELLSKRVYWQPFLIAMFGMFGQQFCGINVVFFYQQTIFEKAHSSIDPSKYWKHTYILTRMVHRNCP